jgi:hypothetical protein
MAVIAVFHPLLRQAIHLNRKSVHTPSSFPLFMDQQNNDQSPFKNKRKPFSCHPTTV